MERRAFLAATTAAALTSTDAIAGGAAAQAGSAASLPILELRRYRLRQGALAARFAAYAKDALVPALGRAGIAPVGAWNVAVGPEQPTVHLLLPHPGAESVVTLAARLDGDAEYRKAAASSLALPPSDPPYVACDVSLHAAVPTSPAVQKPADEAAGPARIFELRTYRSATEAASRRKIEMFEAGGELALFARLGLRVVFFSRDLAAGGLPSLTYMVVFADGAAREKAWAAFGSHPEWVKMREDPRYADTVSRIDSTLLRPTDYSQL
ncbi:MAG TPA: NIPSNAP family protein [Vicinamibacteria bacterium]|nr:NIPSNAP family protein [Vicinamibacteria bacterium]